MSNKKEISKLEKATKILLNSKATQWCKVDIHNNFKFMNSLFKISEDVKEYKVYRKAGEVFDFTNESIMDEVLVVLENSGLVRFYNQNYEEITKVNPIKED